MSVIAQGYALHRQIFSPDEITALQHEADQLAQSEGTACVRHIRSKSPLLHSLSRSEQLLALIPTDYRPARSILFDKTPEENWSVPWHQDLTIAVQEHCDVEGYHPWSEKDGHPHVQPPSTVLQQMVTLRIHLDQTDHANGALYVIPDSHQHGKLHSSEVPKLSKEKSHCCECQPGDVLAMSPLILHSSHRSTNPSRRRIIHFEYAHRDCLSPALRWLED